MDNTQGKKKKISIRDLNDFSSRLSTEGYELGFNNSEEFIDRVAREFNYDRATLEFLYRELSSGRTKYKVDNIEDLLDYVGKILIYQDKVNSLWNSISYIGTLRIHRVEYDRIPCYQEDVTEILRITDALADEISYEIKEEDMDRLSLIEGEIDLDYVYTKDIELLKKIIDSGNNIIDESYNDVDRIKTIVVKMPKEYSFNYIKHEAGTVLYHRFLDDNLPRIERLIRNLDKYIVSIGDGLYEINQSSALQDTINIAAATYNGCEFKSISGSNEIDSYCKSPRVDRAAFISRKVNKLGKLGT
ncbi:MAG: hypothetical protein RSB66_08035, partial [Clostridium sp.]